MDNEIKADGWVRDDEEDYNGWGDEEVDEMLCNVCNTFEPIYKFYTGNKIEQPCKSCYLGDDGESEEEEEEDCRTKPCSCGCGYLGGSCDEGIAIDNEPYGGYDSDDDEEEDSEFMCELVDCATCKRPTMRKDMHWTQGGCVMTEFCEPCHKAKIPDDKMVVPPPFVS